MKCRWQPRPKQGFDESRFVPAIGNPSRKERLFAASRRMRSAASWFETRGSHAPHHEAQFFIAVARCAALRFYRRPTITGLMAVACLLRICSCVVLAPPWKQGSREIRRGAPRTRSPGRERLRIELGRDDL